MQRNDELWAEEHGKVEDTTAPEAGLRAVGVTNAGLQADTEAFTTPEAPAAEPEGAGSAGLPGGASPVVPVGTAAAGTAT
jgi:hypothetical protein